MKKLMVMLSAAALAFGLHAAGGEFISGTAFEDGDGGTSGDLASGYWTLPAEGKGTATITEGSHGITQDGKRPEKFAKAADANNLVIKTTFGNPVELKVDATGKAEKIGDGGLYFDGLVNMTVCDYEDTPVIADANAKLAVYLQAADAEETETKLVIKAGYIGGDAKAYECPGLTEGWHRLTIKAIKNIYTEASGSSQLGFVVFVDGNAVGSTDNDRGIVAANLTPAAAEFYTGKKLFPSMVDGDDITYIGFDGQGKVDELVFTSKAPDFAKDSDFFTLSWEAGVTGFTCGDIVKSGLTEAGSVPVKISLPEKTTEEEPSVVVNVTGITYAEDKVGEATTNFTATAENLAGTITAGTAAANFNGKGYATVAEAIADANAITTPGNYTLKLFEGAGMVKIQNTTAGVNLTLDLAGQTITQGASDEAAVYVVKNAALTITDSSSKKTGVVQAANEGVALDGEGAIVVNAGTFDGAVYSSITINSELPKFSYADNVTGTDCAFTYTMVAPVADKILVADNEESPVYWIVGEPPKQGWAIYLAQGANENEFLIQDAGDLLDLATNLNKTADFATEGITFKQTANIPLTETFPGIGAPNAKDNIRTDETDESQLQTMAENFVNGAFAGTYDGDGKTISGLVIARGDYVGLFNSAYGATIKNVKVSLGSATGVAEGTGDAAVAAILGVSVDTTVENCQTLKVTDYTELKANKAMAGIVAYAAQGTVIKDCVNNLDITSTANEKAGGIVACAQNTKNSKLTVKGTGVEINGCTNNGNVTSGAADKVRAAGLVSYTDNTVTFKGDNVFSGTLTGTGSSYTYIQSVINLASGTVVVDTDATFTVPAAYKTVNQKAVDGLFFATVKDDVATLIKNAAVVLDGSYKVMADGAAYEFTEVGSITFDNSLVQTFAPTTDTTKFTLTNEGYVWTCAEKPAGPTSDEGAIVMPTDGTNVAKFTPNDDKVTEATVNLNGAQVQVAFPTQIETIKGVPANQIIVLNSKGHSIDASAFVGGNETGYSTALTPAAQKPAFATTGEGATAEKPFVVGDETVAVGVQTINGLIYQLQAEAALDNSWTAAGEPVEGNGQPMTFSTGKTDAPAQFYSIKVSK